MQRLFATYPDGLPGIALLLLRVALAGILILDGPSSCATPTILISCFALAGFVIIGVFLPFFAFAGVLAGGTVFLIFGTNKGVECTFVLLVLASLGLLGAGAYSVDGWLFGRRRIIIATPGKKGN